MSSREEAQWAYACSLIINIAEMHDCCVSRNEFESLQKELNYWQNITITILKKYLVDNEGEGYRISMWIKVLVSE